MPPLCYTARPLTTLHRTLILVVVIAAFALRSVAVGELPPGLYHDEAFYGLDAAGVLAGDLHLYFPANNGREPLFVYLVAGFIAMIGQTPAALRLASAFVGTAGVAAAFAMGASLYGRRVGLLTAALMAVAPWPVILGRVGFRAGLLPLVLALAVAATVRGLRCSDQRWIAFGGALAGLSLYTYTAARLVPLAVAVVGLWWLWTRHRSNRPVGIDEVRVGGNQPADAPLAPRLLVLWIAAALLVAAPLVITFALDPATTLGRAGQVSVLAPEISGGDPAAALARNIRGTLGMVFVRGDFIPRHNIPDRPVMGLLGGALWLAGLGLVLGRHRPADILILIWIGVMLLPTLLAENAPHFLRAVGLLPALLVLPALGIDAIAGLARRSGRMASLATPLAALLALVLVGGELVATLAYARAARAPGSTRENLGYAFESASTELAAEVNAAPGAVWLDRRLRDGWAALPFLVDTDRVKLVDPYDPIFTGGPGVAFLQPEGLEIAQQWADHAPGLRIDFRDGPPARGDLETEARPLYVRIDGQPAPAIDTPLARFANGLTLLEVRGPSGGPAPGSEQLTLETVWATERALDAEPTLFFQILDGSRVVAASDAPPGRGVFPALLWRPGDQVVERRTLELPGGYDPARHRIIAGAYTWPSVERIGVIGPDGAPSGDHVELVGER